MRVRRVVLGAIVIAACAAAALASGVVTRGGGATAAATGPCQLGGKHNAIQHVIYLQFDNTHYRPDRSNVASDLEQMPHLLNFLKGNGTLLTNDHTILISHTAGGILASLTGLYPDRNGQTVSNSYDYYQASGVPTFQSSFKYWNNTVAAGSDPLPNMVTDGGATTPAPWLTYTAAGCSVGGVSAANIELENSNAVRVTGGPTALSAAASAGDTNIKVASVSGFSVGQAITVDGEPVTITAVGTAGASGTGITFSPALTKAHAAGTVVYGTVVTDPTGDVTSLFGAGSEAWNEARDSQLALAGTAKRTLALTDLVGIAIHCAVGATSPCTGNSNARPDPATIYAGSDGGAMGLFGAKYVNPAIGGVNGCVKATDGSNITDTFGQCGFPGFDGALAKNTLGEVEAMQLHGVPVTFAYISDAHDNHVSATAMGPGEAAYQQQLKDYDAAFATWFDDLKAHGIDKSNTLFVVTVDEGDHFAGGTGTPDAANPGALTYTHAPCAITAATPSCPANQMGEVTTNLKGILPAGEPSFDLHFDDAPTIYVNGQPNRNDPTVRKLEQDVAGTTAIDPYAGGPVPIAQRLADTVEEKTLHMINADPKRTPTFTLFGNADFFFQASNSGTCGGTTPLCVDSKFAWNHGDYQDEIANTWVGFVGPGVQANGVDSTTWTDHVDYRPTINALLGLKDSYLDDGRAITEILGRNSGNEDQDNSHSASQLGAAYKAINAPFGQLALDTLSASTAALKSTDELKYDRIETQIASLTVDRDTLASTIRQALNDGNVQEDQARQWVTQAQSLLDRAHALAVANPL